MSHSISGDWSLHEGRVGIGELIVMYTRPDDSLYTVKCATILRRRGDKVCDIRTYVDVTQW